MWSLGPDSGIVGAVGHSKEQTEEHPSENKETRKKNGGVWSGDKSHRKMALHFLITAFIEYILREVHGNWHDNHNQHDNDAQDDAQTHLHVFPPHVLAHSVGTTAEALGADGKIICFVLDRVQALASFGNLVDVVSHDADGVIDLLHMLVRVRGNRVGKNIPPGWPPFSSSTGRQSSG